MSIPSPVNDCKMPFIRANFVSGKTIMTIFDAVKKDFSIKQLIL